MHVITKDDEVLRGGKAALFMMREIGNPWAWWFRFVPFIWFVELGYVIVAKNRFLVSKFLFRNE